MERGGMLVQVAESTIAMCRCRVQLFRGGRACMMCMLCSLCNFWKTQVQKPTPRVAAPRCASQIWHKGCQSTLGSYLTESQVRSLPAATGLHHYGAISRVTHVQLHTVCETLRKQQPATLRTCAGWLELATAVDLCATCAGRPGL
jgi:hypothetical protein